MKRLIFLLAFAAATTAVVAQTDFYANPTSISAGDITYRISTSDTYYIIGDSSNTLSDQPLMLKDGTRVYHKDGYGSSARSNVSYYNSFVKAFHEVFSGAEMDMLKDEQLVFGIAVNPDTGRIEEITFLFRKISPLRFVAPTKFRELEKKIKQYLSYTIVFPSDKQLQAIYLTHPINFKHILQYRPDGPISSTASFGSASRKLLITVKNKKSNKVSVVESDTKIKIKAKDDNGTIIYDDETPVKFNNSPLIVTMRGSVDIGQLISAATYSKARTFEIELKVAFIENGNTYYYVKSYEFSI